MLTYTFETKGNKSYYQFLYEKLKEDIQNGLLKAHTKLPSKRSFAKHLSLSVMTIEHAYAQLQIEGYIYAIEKKGYYIAELQKTNQISQKVSDQIEPSTQKTNYFADFTSNAVSADYFPFATWSKLMRRVLSEAKPELLTSAPAQGIFDLRKAISEHLQHFRGMQVSPHQIIIGAGTEYFYSLLVQLLGKHQVYGVENPGYLKLSHIYKSLEVPFRYIDVDQEGIAIEALLQSDVQVMHLSPSHHFPTGIVMPIARRQALLNWAHEKSERYIIEDDFDCEFRFSGLPVPTMQSIDTHDSVIYLNTFSKTLTPSIRISYMVLPPALLKRYEAKLGFYACTVSNFEQYTLAAFMSEGYFEKHLNRMRNYYRSKRNLMIQTIKSGPLAPYATILEEDAGLHFILQLKTDLEDRQLIEKAKQVGIKLSCLADYSYYSNRVFSHLFVINYTSIHEAHIEEALRRLAQLLTTKPL